MSLMSTSLGRPARTTSRSRDLGAYELAPAASAAAVGAAHVPSARAAASPRRNGPAHLRRPATWPAEAIPERPGGFDQLAGQTDHLLLASHPFVDNLGRGRGDNRRRLPRPSARRDAMAGSINCRLPG